MIEYYLNVSFTPPSKKKIKPTSKLQINYSCYFTKAQPRHLAFLIKLNITDFILTAQHHYFDIRANAHCINDKFFLPECIVSWTTSDLATWRISSNGVAVVLIFFFFLPSSVFNLKILFLIIYYQFTYST